MRNVLILGAAGRDFHNFIVRYRDDAAVNVVAFTATQIPGIDARTFPRELAGERYPAGIPIVPEVQLADLVRAHRVDDVVFAYSDVTHEHVMHLASIALASGASFQLLGPRDTMLQSRRPVIAVLASRTGAGKSTIARYVMRALKAAGAKPVAIRHPMPYGRLSMAVERYATPRDVVEGEISVEAMEEYQQHVADGSVVYAGVDYARILAAAEQEGDVIVWDGGNNDTSFLWPDVTVTVLDPTRPLDGARFFPGEVNIRAADILVVNKVNVASANDVEACIADAALLSQSAAMIRMESVEAVDRPELVRNRRVLAIDDGPSLTHGGMSEGVAARAARMLGAELIDPRGHAIGSIARAFERYAHIGPVLPALGYDQAQLDDLARTIEGVACDTVLLGTPAPLDRLISIRRPVARASFHARDRGTASLAKAIRDKLSQRRSNETGCGREARPSP